MSSDTKNGDDSWYLSAQRQYEDWSKEMVGIAVSGEGLRDMISFFVGPPPKSNMWPKFFDFLIDNGFMISTGQFMPTKSGKKSTKVYEVLK